MATFVLKVFLLIKWFSDIARKETICAGVAAVRTARALCLVHEHHTTRKALLVHSEGSVDVAHRCEVSYER
jgi:hypothetical protein